MPGTTISAMPARTSAQIQDTDMLPVAIGTLAGDNRKVLIGDLKAIMQGQNIGISQPSIVLFVPALPFFAIPSLNLVLPAGKYKIDFSTYIQSQTAGDGELEYEIVFNTNTSLVNYDPTDVPIFGSDRKQSAIGPYNWNAFTQGLLTNSNPVIIKVLVKSVGTDGVNIFTRSLNALKLS
jgi:hypothetical protein